MQGHEVREGRSDVNCGQGRPDRAEARDFVHETRQLATVEDTQRRSTPGASGWNSNEETISRCILDRMLSRKQKIASAGNRARVTSMATMYSTTRPLMLMINRRRRSNSA